MTPILGKKELFSFQNINILFVNSIIFGWYILSEQNLLGLIVLIGVEMLIIAGFSLIKDFLYLTNSMRVDMDGKSLVKTLGIYAMVILVLGIVYGGYVFFFAYGSAMIFFVSSIALVGSETSITLLLANSAIQQAIILLLAYQILHFVYQTFFDKSYFKFETKEGNELPFFRQFLLQTFFIILLGIFLVFITGIITGIYFVFTDLAFDTLVSHPVIITSLGLMVLLVKTYIDILWEHKRPGRDTI